MDRRAFLVFVAGGCATMAATACGSGHAVAGVRHLIPQQGPITLPVRDYITRMDNFDMPDAADVILEPARLAVLQSVAARLARTERTVGHGNFCILSFDEALRYAKSYAAIGEFTSVEKDLLDELFHTDASAYGFYGEKPVTRLTQHIPPRELTKVPRMGNWLFRGPPEETWQAIRASIGDSVILTSGVRGVVKQFMLFLSKAVVAGGNLSLASRSLAPPGYSFHAVSDFDVGQQGFGKSNFSARFTKTDVFRKLKEQGYVTLRYPQGNLLGVRFEPWHIKVAA